MNLRNEESRKKPSRGEIEMLCILHAVGPSGCPVSDLVVRLGLSTTLEAVVAQGMDRVIFAGLLEQVDERFRLTAQGSEMLTTRLRELGLESRWP